MGTFARGFASVPPRNHPCGARMRPSPNRASRVCAEHVGTRMRRASGRNPPFNPPRVAPSDSGRGGARRTRPTRGACGLVWARRARHARRMERQTANRPCVGCGAPTLCRANALRCAVCARHRRMAHQWRTSARRCIECARAIKARRKREARAVEIAKRAPRPCAKCERAIEERLAQTRYCAECAKPKPARGPRNDRYCVGCGVNMGPRRSDARRCKACARPCERA